VFDEGKKERVLCQQLLTTHATSLKHMANKNVMIACRFTENQPSTKNEMYVDQMNSVSFTAHISPSPRMQSSASRTLKY